MSSIPKRSAEDRFRYGWRVVPRQRPDGSIEYEETPLTAEDFLDPQEGDQWIQGTDHTLMDQQGASDFEQIPEVQRYNS